MHAYTCLSFPKVFTRTSSKRAYIKTLQFCGRIFFGLIFVRAILRESVFFQKKNWTLATKECNLMVFHISNLFKTKTFEFLTYNKVDCFVILAKLPKIWHTFDLSFCNKLKLLTFYIFTTWWLKPLIFQT